MESFDDADVETIHIHPLTELSALNFARSRAPGTPDHELAQLARISDGNPLVLTELLSTPSDSLVASILTRFEGLSPAARVSAARLIALGRPLAADLAGNGLDELFRAGFARSDGRSAQIAHDVLATHLSELIDDETRRAAHHYLAEHLEPAESARHLVLVGRKIGRAHV